MPSGTTMWVAAAVSVGAIITGCASSTRDVDSRAATSSASVATAAAADATFAFPVGVSADKRYLVDQHGAPYLVVGDSPQCLSTNMAPAEMEYYFADRQRRGFNMVWVNLLCGVYTRGHADASTYDGIKPFLRGVKGGQQALGDLSAPNPAYFERMDVMIGLAARHGLTVLLDPAETGSFHDLLQLNGVDKSLAFGKFLGERYRDAPNVMWMLGNDFKKEQWDEFRQVELALAAGIRQGAPSALQTVELNPDVSTSYDDPAWPPVIDVATAYSYFPTYDVMLRAYNATPRQPVLMIEANYEGENNDGGPTTTDETLRRQEWWTMLSGSTGQFYGNGYTWGINGTSWKRWKDHLDTKAVGQLADVTRFFAGRSWEQLVPDQSHTFLVGGYGTYSDSGDVLRNDYAVAAVTPDGSLGVIYTPTAHELEVDASKLRPGSIARWYDPANGAFRPAVSPFVTPGANAAGGRDWVLVFEVPKP